MSIEFQIETETLIASASAIAALLASLFAYKSYLVSKKTMKLQESEHKSKSSNLAVYLDQAYKTRDVKSGNTIASFCLAYSNKSESIDSISQVYLETHYINDSGKSCSLIDNHRDEHIEKSISGKPAKLPIALEPRTTKTNWFVFKVPELAVKSNRIEKYSITGMNGKGNKVSIDSYILQEIHHEKTHEKA